MKLIVDIPDEEYKTLSKMSEKEKVNELSYYERVIANGIPYEERPQGEWIIDGHHIRCTKCNEYICNTDREGDKIPDNFCPNCGADMRGEEE